MSWFQCSCGASFEIKGNAIKNHKKEKCRPLTQEQWKQIYSKNKIKLKSILNVKQFKKGDENGQKKET